MRSFSIWGRWSVSNQFYAGIKGYSFQKLPAIKHVSYYITLYQCISRSRIWKEIVKNWLPNRKSAEHSCWNMRAELLSCKRKLCSKKCQNIRSFFTADTSSFISQSSREELSWDSINLTAAQHEDTESKFVILRARLNVSLIIRVHKIFSAVFSFRPSSRSVHHFHAGLKFAMQIRALVFSC